MGGVLCVKWYHLWVPDPWHGSYWFPGHPWANWHLCFSERNSGGPSTLWASKGGTQMELSSCRALWQHWRNGWEGGVRWDDETQTWGIGTDDPLDTRDAGVRPRWIPNPGDITCPSEAVCRGTICKLRSVQPEPSPCVILAINSFGKKRDLKKGTCYFLKRLICIKNLQL